MANWNENQKKVLDSLKEEKNILVSAAAGSGKTAVMVERIIRTVESGMANIDEILVVTFMVEAAAQMKAKIIKRLEDMAAVDKTGRMATQLALAENADIMTIDGFCNKVVRENFNVVGMDPAFEICDKSEVELLKDEVLDKVLDKYYLDNEIMAKLTGFVFEKNINDGTFKESILRIHTVASSFANPRKFLEDSREVVSEDGKEILNQKWVRDYVNYYNNLAEAAISVVRDICAEVDQMNHEDPKGQQFFDKLRDTFSGDLCIYENFKKAETLQEKKGTLPDRWPGFPKSTTAEKYMDLEYFNKLKSIRDGIRDSFKAKDIIIEEKLQQEAVEQQAVNSILIDIVEDFDEQLMKEKSRLKKYEFSDIAHAAYKTLYDVETDEPTKVGLAKSLEYKYIYIDEYQDSSDIQESILNAIARRDVDGNPKNIFMVGDVKQSIYHFRQARPELFVDKSHSYGNLNGGILFNLNMNYRSRKEILSGTNFVFRKVMTESFGGIAYTKDVELNSPDESDYQNHYPDTDLNVGGPVSYIRVLPPSGEDSNVSELSNDEIQAIEIGKRILEIVNGNEEKCIAPTYVINEKYNPDKPESESNSKYRKATFRDIVLLQFSVKNQLKLVKIYEQLGVPVHICYSDGYFRELEVSTLLSVLRVIDNIQQDIPYASVLLSHIGGLSDADMTTVVGHTVDNSLSLSDRCKLFEEGYRESEDGKLRRIADKLNAVTVLLDKWSCLKPYLSISDLLDMILKDTDYEAFVAAMPRGERRIQNIRKLCYYAKRFEEGRTSGLLEFLKYIDKCDLHGEEMADDSKDGFSNDNVVNMTTIHKSKGLEYPIVILSSLEKAFKNRDTSGNISVSQDYHLIIKRMRVAGKNIRMKRSSSKEAIVKVLAEREMKTEKARLLYVGMTRAKEKLLMIGSGEDTTPAVINNVKSNTGFVDYALFNSKDESALCVEEISSEQVVEDFQKIYSKKSLDYSMSYEDMMVDIMHAVENEEKERIKLGTAEINPYDLRYIFEKATNQKSKMSVSEIKHAEMKKSEIVDNSDELETQIISEEELKEEAQQKEQARRKAARRGTVIHAIFENLNYDVIVDDQTLHAEMERILDGKEFDDEDRKLVNIKSLSGFYNEYSSSLFQRMKKAFSEGKLHREQQFISGVSIKDLPGKKENLEGYSQDDYVIIQGIIDAFFYEGPNEDIILVDYKTDNVKEGQELIDRYGAQMYLYGLTLEKLTGHRVADCILYSTRLGEVHYSNWREYCL